MRKKINIKYFLKSNFQKIEESNIPQKRIKKFILSPITAEKKNIKKIKKAQ